MCVCVVYVRVCVCACMCEWCLCVCACMHVMICSWEVDRVADRQVCMLAVYSQSLNRPMYVCMYVNESRYVCTHWVVLVVSKRDPPTPCSLPPPQTPASRRRAGFGLVGWTRTSWRGPRRRWRLSRCLQRKSARGASKRTCCESGVKR